MPQSEPPWTSLQRQQTSCSAWSMDYDANHKLLGYQPLQTLF